MSRPDRRRLIQTIVSEDEIGTQRELVRALQELGCHVAQATVSRDARELGLQKVRTHLGRPRYVTSLYAHTPDPEQAASQVMGDFCLATAVAQNIVVVRCEIGTASTVARAVDNLHHRDIIGTLAGGDTFVVFLKDVRGAEEMMGYLDHLRGV